MLLVTGFEPFGGEAVNPSWEAVSLLPDTILGERVEKVRLPVSYARCADAIHDALARDDLRGVLLVGQAGGRAHIAPELAALNRMHAAPPDGDGAVACHQSVIEGGPAAYLSTFDGPAMAQALRAAGIPAAVSYHAGTYVCNALLYCVLHRLEALGRARVPAGFVHVPYAAAQAAAREGAPPPSLPLGMIAEGVRICAETLL